MQAMKNCDLELWQMGKTCFLHGICEIQPYCNFEPSYLRKACMLNMEIVILNLIIWVKHAFWLCKLRFPPLENYFTSFVKSRVWLACNILYAQEYETSDPTLSGYCEAWRFDDNYSDVVLCAVWVWPWIFHLFHVLHMSLDMEDAKLWKWVGELVQ